MSSINKIIISVIVLIPCISLAIVKPGVPSVRGVSSVPGEPAVSNVIMKPAVSQNLYQQIQEISQKLAETETQMMILSIRLKVLSAELKQSIEKSTGSHYQWVKGVVGEAPANAVSAWQNFDGPVNICQANYFGGVHPGQLTKNGCRITYAWKAYNEKTFNVLTSNKTPEWKDQSAMNQSQENSWPVYGGVGPVIMDGQINGSHSQPVVGGHENGHDLYVCRCMYNNNVHVGKVVANNCNIGSEGKEVKVPDYEVLFL